MFGIASLSLLSLLVLASWVSWGMMVFVATPELLVNRLFFFVLLFTSIFSGGALAAYGLGRRLFPLKRDRGRLGLALLQGLPLGFSVAFAAWLQSLRLFTWINALILVGILGMLEYVLLPRTSGRL